MRADGDEFRMKNEFRIIEPVGGESNNALLDLGSKNSGFAGRMATSIQPCTNIAKEMAIGGKHLFEQK
jgi:hypothetical protein